MWSLIFGAIAILALATLYVLTRKKPGENVETLAAANLALRRRNDDLITRVAHLHHEIGTLNAELQRKADDPLTSKIVRAQKAKEREIVQGWLDAAKKPAPRESKPKPATRKRVK